jgi:2,4-dienoyl-CoA reductase-like NADH-dependent reductase (Old Yellow Enzyme family)
MWRPPNAKRHELLPARWPTHHAASTSRWFSPIALGPIVLDRRTWVPAMVPWRASEDGFVTEDVVDWYTRFARGRPGALVVEATGIRDVPSGPLLRIGHDRFLPGLERLARAVHAASGGETRLLIQVIDFLKIRRRPAPDRYFSHFLQITPRHRELTRGHAGSEQEIRRLLAQSSREELARLLTPRELESLEYGYRERVTDLHLAEVRDLPATLPGWFADAASRAERAGFDGVELHYAHAYTMASFLSAANTRGDGYGVTLDGRLKLPLEVLAAVRASVGDRFAVGCRILSDECIAGGTELGDAEEIACALGSAGAAFLSLSRGGKFEDAKQPAIGWAAYPYTGHSGWECMPTTLADEAGPFGRNVPASRRIRATLRARGLDTPVVVSGGISSFEQAEEILGRGDADVVAAARQTLADPDWFEKIRLGRGGEIRRCVFTNYCEGLDQKHKQVTCKLWDRQGLDEPGVRRTSDGKRRLVAPDWVR